VTLSGSPHAVINYAARTNYRPRYFANDHSRDTVVIDPVAMMLINGRECLADLDVQGFALVDHKSVVGDFTDAVAVAAVHPQEIIALIQAQTGADEVHVTAPGILRFSEKSKRAGQSDNSMPARFAHVDISDATAAQFVSQGAPSGKIVRRHAHYNIWRAISVPPQDVPLALCDARSVSAQDFVEADAVFDMKGQPEWSFEGWVVGHNPDHRWHWFPDMHRDEVIIFKTNDSDASAPHCVPHVAFDDITCPPDAPPRMSIEMRATAYWYA
jgi:hypothetical protein